MAHDDTPIHPELRATAKKFPRLPLNRWTVPVTRLLMGFMPLPKAPADVRISNLVAPGENAAHKVGLRVYQPGRATAPAARCSGSTAGDSSSATPK